jgi:hypothetical protein
VLDKAANKRQQIELELVSQIVLYNIITKYKKTTTVTLLFGDLLFGG